MDCGDSITWEDYQIDGNEEDEYRMTRKIQDDEWEKALRDESRKSKKLHDKKQEIEISSKKSKTLENPSLMPYNDHNAIHLRFRCFTGKMTSCKFHRDELVLNVIKQLQWELKITSQIQLIVLRNKLEAHQTLSQSNVMDRTMISIETL